MILFVCEDSKIDLRM